MVKGCCKAVLPPASHWTMAWFIDAFSFHYAFDSVDLITESFAMTICTMGWNSLWMTNLIFVLSSFQEKFMQHYYLLLLINACIPLRWTKVIILILQAGFHSTLADYYCNLLQVPYISGMFLSNLVGSGEPARLLKPIRPHLRERGANTLYIM